MSATRRFYGFNSAELVQSHVSQINTLEDLIELRDDIIASRTNLTVFRLGNLGVYSIEHKEDNKMYRHVFMLKTAYERCSIHSITAIKAISITFKVLEN